MSSLNIDQRIAAGPPAYADTYKAAEHFRDKDHEFDSVKFGVWLFLATEVLLFSGLFCYYGIMRLMYPEAFIHGSSLLDWRWGLINTVVLLCSSFTAAAAVRDAQLGRQFWLKVNLLITLLAGVAFLIIKFVFEYYPKWAEGKLPGEFYSYPNWVSPNEVHWWGVYWSATGVHASHVVVGMGLYIWLLIRAFKGHFGPKHYSACEGVALYWHIVDIVWIFLFPMLYLIH
ncbi:MAG: cytochrome c oxidase subunit 3 [Phycisphaerales bacterium]|jgi:cytochrome c oxidase subunit 3|nr:cytochrome c oxidase subunit 3 [Phycisphaeraceae bacterium]